MFDLQHVLNCADRATATPTHKSKGKFWARQESQWLVLTDQKTVVGAKWKCQRNLITEDVTAEAGPRFIAEHAGGIVTIAASDDCSRILVGDNKGVATQYKRKQAEWLPERRFADVQIGTIFAGAFFGDLAVLGGERRFCVVNTESGWSGRPVASSIGNLLSVQVYRAEDSEVYLAMSGYSFELASNRFELRELARLAGPTDPGSLGVNRQLSDELELDQTPPGQQTELNRLRQYVRQLQDANLDFRKRVSVLESQCAELGQQAQEYAESNRRLELSNRRFRQCLSGIRNNLDQVQPELDGESGEGPSNGNWPSGSDGTVYPTVGTRRIFANSRKRSPGFLEEMDRFATRTEDAQKNHSGLENVSSIDKNPLGNQSDVGLREQKVKVLMQGIESQVKRFCLESETRDSVFRFE